MTDDHKDDHKKPCVFCTVGGYPPEEPEHVLALRLSPEAMDNLLQQLLRAKELAEGRRITTFVEGTISLSQWY